MCDSILPFSHLDADDFVSVIYELRVGPVRFDFDRLSSLFINPLTSDFERFLARSDDLDPDVHFNVDGCCSFYVEDKLNEMLRKEFFLDSQFALLHLNVRSLQNKVDDLSFFLSSLNVKFSVIGITETWLRDLSPVVNLNGYHFVYKNRSDRSGGGVGMCIANNLDFKMRTDICFDDEEVMESLLIEITRPQGKTLWLVQSIDHHIKMLMIL